MYIMKNKRRGFFYCIYPALIYLGVNLLVSVIFTFIIRFAMFNDGADVSNLDALYNTIIEYTLRYSTYVTLAITLIAGTICYLLYRKDEKIRFENAFYNDMSIKDYLMCLLTGVGIYMLVDVIVVILSGLINMTGVIEANDEAISMMLNGKFVLEIIVYCVVAPAVEELVFRGMVFNRMRSMVGTKRAIWASALIFACMHTGGLLQMAYAFALGYLMAWVYSRYCNLKAPVCIHMAFNIMNYVFMIPALAAFFSGENTLGNVIFYVLAIGLCYISYKYLKNVKHPKIREEFIHRKVTVSNGDAQIIENSEMTAEETAAAETNVGTDSADEKYPDRNDEEDDQKEENGL